MSSHPSRLALASILALLALNNVAMAQRGRGGMVGNRGGGEHFSRPSAPQNFSRPNFERPNFNQNFNRPNINQNFNRPANFNQNFNRPNINQNFNRPVSINQNNFNRANFVPNNINHPGYGGGFGGYNPGNRGWGGNGGFGYGSGYHGNSYYGYHSNWVNGSWGGNFYPGWGGYGGYYGNNFGINALGIGVGTGIAAWGIGSLINNWGYSSYSNPYYQSSPLYTQQALGVAGPGPGGYDYSRPLNLASPPPDETIVQSAGATLDSAREAFHAGDYVQALAMADQALTQTPNDPMLHEFRAICLFAQRRYDEAAIPFYTVLSAGPGWDWTTLIGLYPDVETYTEQLRALETFCNATPRAASARFVLAAIYLTQGSTPAAATRLQEVVALQPQDRLSAQLLNAILAPQNQPQSQAQTQGQSQPTQSPNPTTANNEVPPANPSPAQAPALPTGPIPTDLIGSWKASPSQNVTISLTLAADNSFNWNVVERGQTREFKGTATSDNGVLALSSPQMPPMVAKVTVKDGDHFNFKAIGTPADDPGLDFAR